MRRCLVCLRHLAVASLLCWPAGVQAQPYPPSTVIKEVQWDVDSHVSQAPGSDNWPVTWADDDHQYAAWGDGGGFGGDDANGRVSLGVARIEGSADGYQGRNVWGGVDALAPARFDGKSYGILGTGQYLLMWVNPGSGADGYVEQRLYSSADHALTWQGVDWAFARDDGLVNLTFAQFGRAYAGARDGYLYIYAVNVMDDSDLVVQQPGQIMLLRVVAEKVLERQVYEFFAGRNGNDQPRWSSEISERRPVFEDGEGVGWNVSVSYNAGLKRYLLATEHTRSFEGRLGLFDAPQPWGPWTTVAYRDDFLGLGPAFFWNFSNKWLSADGKEFTMIFTGIDDLDSWNSIRGRFELHQQLPADDGGGAPDGGAFDARPNDGGGEDEGQVEAGGPGGDAREPAPDGEASDAGLVEDTLVDASDTRAAPDAAPPDAAPPAAGCSCQIVTTASDGRWDYCTACLVVFAALMSCRKSNGRRPARRRFGIAMLILLFPALAAAQYHPVDASPMGVITTPTADTTFYPGEKINFAGFVEGQLGSGGLLPASLYHWTIVEVDNEEKTLFGFDGQDNGAWTAPDVTQVKQYFIKLHAVDPSIPGSEFDTGQLRKTTQQLRVFVAPAGHPPVKTNMLLCARDAYVDEGEPDTWVDVGKVLVKNPPGSGGARLGYWQFTFGAARVDHALFSLFSNSECTDEGIFQLGYKNGEFQDGGITWNTRPPDGEFQYVKDQRLAPETNYPGWLNINITDFFNAHLGETVTFRFQDTQPRQIGPEFYSLESDYREVESAGQIHTASFESVNDPTPPSAPSNLAAGGWTETSISLVWTAAADAESGVSLYRVYRDGGPAGTTRGTTFTDTGLKPATKYAYQVAAVNGGGVEGPKSPAVSATTLADAGLTVTGLSRPAYYLGTLAVGKPVYLDRDYAFTDVGALAGAVYVLTANDDKTDASAEFLSFQLNRAAVVYVGFDENYPAPPWLASWTAAPAKVIASHAAYALFVRTFPSGKVVLGGPALDAGGNMYTVIIVPDEGPPGPDGGAGADGAPQEDSGVGTTEAGVAPSDAETPDGSSPDDPAPDAGLPTMDAASGSGDGAPDDDEGGMAIPRHTAAGGCSCAFVAP
ncbi:MAG: DUF4185 domain-containing protein [Deltaproteobacteria bacterium]|nr:DUF4185 domain-containing protein [Deltaproteobacteria bacterium]